MAWGLYPKIREMDELLQSRDELRQIIREVHPEVCFQAWSGGRAMRSSKKTPAGKAERLALAVGWLGTGVLDKARGTCPRSKVGDDDILDAIGALWSAARIFAGIAEMLPASPESDSTGLRMEIVY
jgi:predicted RNase H-like nuclease